MEGFKSGKYRVLIATDIAARGIDVKGIELVVNFDLPDNANDYIHRIGRTGRAGHAGRAISFATPDQKDDVNAIERLLKTSLRTSKVPGFGNFSASELAAAHKRPPARGYSRGRRPPRGRSNFRRRGPR